MDPTIFRQYDIRGRFPGDFNSLDFEKIALTFGLTFPEESHIAVGYDARLSGPELENSACLGLEAAGIIVHQLGMIPTPLCYFYVCSENLDGAIMITSSHNPKDWNGAKLMREKAVCLTWEEGIKDLRDRVLEGREDTRKKPEGSKKIVDCQDAYVNHVISRTKVNSNLRIVVDCSNGPNGSPLRRIFDRLGISFELINEVPDGNFPAHAPDVFLKEVEQAVSSHVLDTKADIGFAIDGDGDRLRVFDEQGKPVSNDTTLGLLAEQILLNHPGTTILHEIRTGLGADKFIRNLGGNIALCKSGHSYIMSELMNLHPASVLAGELTGHYFFAENYFFDDALFALVKTLEVLTKKETPLSILCKDFPAMEEAPTQKINVPDSLKHQVVETLIETLGDVGGKISTIDGLRIDFDDAFVLVRAKNTEAAIETRFQAETKSRLVSLQTRILGALENILERMVISPSK